MSRTPSIHLKKNLSSVNQIFCGSAEFHGFGVKFGHHRDSLKSGENEFGGGGGGPILCIASCGFSDGFGVKYADNTQRITFDQYRCPSLSSPPVSVLRAEAEIR